ncbi:hypothetical protein HC030_24590 [Planosporangium mesophilum]|nr:hypothetical protein [Planosporangium mesophilum]
MDVGGVVVDRATGGEDTSFFGSHPLRTPAVDGAFEVLTVLAAHPFAGRVHLVSKAGPKVAANTRAWLAHHRFFEQTGIPAHHLHFVRERSDKARVCQRLGITHFVDDQLDVLRHLTTVEYRYLFVGGLGEEQPPQVVPAWATTASTWMTLVDQLRTSVPLPPA